MGKDDNNWEDMAGLLETGRVLNALHSHGLIDASPAPKRPKLRLIQGGKQ